MPTTPPVNFITTDLIPVPPAAAPAKRGRKPGPLSRSAREAQRRLNHSIIEKARRTKINDALATLRQLVPVEYNSTQPQNELHDDDDDEYPEECLKKTKSKPKLKNNGKREEKEKEFKLEILVRTVSFLQDLLKRVDAMEASSPVCQNCGEFGKKRKRNSANDSDDNQVLRSVVEPPPKVLKSHSTLGPARLPSISSWLPNDVIDSTLSPSNKPKQSVSPNLSAYLPSPPPSGCFDPIRTSQVPPVLNLGPVATAAMVTLPRTSEDESAASLLLQIAASPPFRPSLPTNSSFILLDPSYQSYNLPDPSNFLLRSDPRNQRVGQARQPQTPGSLLGLQRRK